MTTHRRILTQHSVVRFTVLRAAPPCPVFEPGDVFFARQHILDTEVSVTKNFCYHTLVGLHNVFERVRRGPVGGKETFSCRDKGMVEFEVERLPDEEAAIGRAETRRASPAAHTHEPDQDVAAVRVVSDLASGQPAEVNSGTITAEAPRDEV